MTVFVDQYSPINTNYDYDFLTSGIPQGPTKFPKPTIRIMGHPQLDAAIQFIVRWFLLEPQNSVKYYPDAEKIREVFDRVTASSDRPELQYKIRVIRSGSINAYAAPGSQIYITKGLLDVLKTKDESKFFSQDNLEELSFEDKLAAVLGHEIAHVNLEHLSIGVMIALLLHCIEALLCEVLAVPVFALTVLGCEVIAIKIEDLIMAAFNLLRSYVSQRNEYDADRYGMLYAARAGYKPEASLWLRHKFLETDEDRHEGDWRHPWFYLTDLLHSHPNPEKRLRANRVNLQDLKSEPLIDVR